MTHHYFHLISFATKPRLLSSNGISRVFILIDNLISDDNVFWPMDIADLPFTMAPIYFFG